LQSADNKSKSGFGLGDEFFDLLAAFSSGIILVSGVGIHPGGPILEDRGHDVIRIEPSGVYHRTI
jgi:hypothetical protein